MLYVYWFRKDLRTDDNAALAGFFKNLPDGSKFCLIYIKNRNSFNYFGEKRISFLNESLKELSRSLSEKDLDLQIIEGKSAGIFREITEKYGKVILYFNRQVEPYCIKRDKEVKEIIDSVGGQVFDYNDTCILEPGEVKNEAGDQYRVYTPFKNKSLGIIGKSHYANIRTDLSSLKKENETDLSLNRHKSIKSEDLKSSVKGIIEGGRNSGISLLKEFYENGISEYKEKRDIPSVTGTSMLSAHLHFGTVGIREAMRTAMSALNKAESESSKTGIQTWINELLWREFYYHITFFNPRLTSESFRNEYDDLNWSYDEELFDKWCRGMTGFPIVDAGMRQLNSEGWLHNRVRMITAMFLTKDLFIDWRLGEKYFAENLIDMDFSSNNGGWQWCASTGVDAQPYFRIFNPYLQSKKFDPKGDYIRKYIPELKNVPSEFIHEPDKMSSDDMKKYNVIIGKDYPAGITEHSLAKERVVSEFKKIKKY
ncbi:MAG: deoxyribodipyrimidine photo-lyase [Bacteroidetes bacterium]|nr:deoxyribodipyrimidine photo-lyase [Bacteroidota bacterium]